MRRVYNKLVRDHIPAIIQQHGDISETEIMTEVEFQQALRQKLVEEAQEVIQANSQYEIIKELADLHEVIDTLMQHSDITMDMIKAEQERRCSERGGFTQRTKLLWTE